MKKQITALKTVLLCAALMLASAPCFQSVATPVADDTQSENNPPKIYSLQVQALSRLCQGNDVPPSDDHNTNIHDIMENTFPSEGYHGGDLAGTPLCHADIDALSYAFGLGQLGYVLSMTPCPLMRASVLKDASALRNLTFVDQENADASLATLHQFKDLSLELLSTAFQNPAIQPALQQSFIRELIRRFPLTSRMPFAIMGEKLFGLETAEAAQCRAATLKTFDPTFPHNILALMRTPREATIRRFSGYIDPLFMFSLDVFDHELMELEKRFHALDAPEKEQKMTDACAQYLGVMPDVFQNMPKKQKSHLFTQRFCDLCVPLLNPVPTSRRLDVLQEIIQHIPLERRAEITTELSTSCLLQKCTGQCTQEYFDHTLLMRLIASVNQTPSACLLETNELINVIGANTHGNAETLLTHYFGACAERRAVIMHTASRIKATYPTQFDRIRLLDLALKGDETDLAAQDMRINVLFRFESAFKSYATGVHKDFCFQILETLTSYGAEQQNALLNDLFAPCMDVLLASEQPTWSENLIESLVDVDSQERTSMAGLIAESMTIYMEHRKQLTGKKPKGTTLNALIEALMYIDPTSRQELVNEAMPFFLSTDKCMLFGPFLTSVATLEPDKRAHFVNACAQLAPIHTAPLVKFKRAIQDALRNTRALTLHGKRERASQTPGDISPPQNIGADVTATSSSSPASQMSEPLEKKPRAL